MKKALIFDTYDDYNIRIQYVQSALERNGYETEIYFADFDHVRKEYYANKRIGIHYLHVEPYQKNLSYARMHSHAQFAKTCIEEAEKHTDVSLIYVMVPPNSMVKQFSIYKRKHPNVKVWFDVLDMWPESLPVSNSLKKMASPVLNIWANLRNRYLNDADCITSECDLFQTVLNKYTNKEIHTIYLSQPNRIIDGFDDLEEYHFLYCGSINHIIDIDQIVTFLKEVKEKKKITIDIIGEGENRNTFLDELKKYEIPYEYHGIVYDEFEKESIFQHCHFGINVMKDTVFVGLTMKSLDYLSYGIPLINNIQGDSFKIVEKEKIGFNLTSDVVTKITSMTKEDYFQMKKQTKEIFLKYFENDTINQKFDSVIKQMEDAQ